MNEKNNMCEMFKTTIVKTNKLEKINNTYKNLVKYIGVLIIKLMDKNNNKDFILSKYKHKLARLIKKIKKILENDNKNDESKQNKDKKITRIKTSELVMISDNIKNIYRYINEYFV